MKILSKLASLISKLNPFRSGASLAGRIASAVALVIVLYLVAAPFVCWVNYDRTFKPFFDPMAQQEQGKPIQPGVVFTDTLITLGDQLTEAWLPNDLLYPTIMMDNPQNYQMGELEVMRYATRVLRDKLSRQRTTDKIDVHADKAYTEFSNNPHLWMFPAAETKFENGVEALTAYRAGLQDGTSHFYARADNLIELLDQFTSLLGGVDNRLLNAPREGSDQMSVETAGDPNLQGEKRVRVRVPWTEIDDNFYRARGVAYGLRQVLVAVRYEFGDVLKIKRSEELVDNIIEELALAQFEPVMVLNGSRESVFANHSLKLMATLEDVRQKLLNLQMMLER